jgi:hypothetical protein
MKWLLIIVGVSNSNPDIKPETVWSDHATIEACKAAGITAETIVQQRGYTITGMSCIGHNTYNTVDFHFDIDGSRQ